ncbi:MAG: hypothetical protein BGO69_12630 [Bacteroidetes bacterium 46-16]|nr:MAG: hypothetical protein BGO69_12630 [Bacteroidetes bacterium 46-16]
MASFSLRSQRTGQYKEFSLLELLKLLGDQVNDEIWLENGEDVYNLSSFREIGGGGDGGGHRENWSVEAPIQTAGQRTFYLQYSPATPLLLVILNGIVQIRNKDYNLEGKAVSFSFSLNAQDSLQFIYQF